MSVIPEILLQTAIVRGIQRMRSDTRLIDQMFRNLSQRQLQQLREFVKTQAFDLAINYPRTALKVPAIVILLKDGGEREAFLGDSMGLDVPDEFSWEGPVDDVLGGTASVATLAGNPRVVFGPYRASGGTENTLRIGQREWVTDQFLVGSHTVRIVKGFGAGQIREISGNGPTTLMVSKSWLRIPDATSVFEITRPVDETVGEPSSLYDRNNPPDALERKGALYDGTVQVQVIGPNPELTIYLNFMLKSIFNSFRMFLEGQGIINLVIRETDFAPRPEYQPDLSYLRALNLSFIYPFDQFEPIENVARSFRLVLEGQQPDGSILGVPILSDTSFTIDPNAAIGGQVVNAMQDAQRIYFGSAAPPVSIDANFVQNTLGGSLITGRRQHAINFISGPGEKMYFALPARFGGDPGDFLDGQTGLPAGFSVVSSINLTTSFGTELFNVWVSDNAGLGFVSVSVQ